MPVMSHSRWWNKSRGRLRSTGPYRRLSSAEAVAAGRGCRYARICAIADMAPKSGGGGGLHPVRGGRMRSSVGCAIVYSAATKVSLPR